MPIVRKKLFLEKFSNVNAFNSLNIKSISLSFLTNDVNDILLKSSVLYLISSKRPQVISRILSKKSKASKEYIGCKVILWNNEATEFFKYLILIVIAQNLSNEGIKFSLNENKFGSYFEFIMNDLLIFPELNKEVDKFYGLKGLKVSIQFKNPTLLNHFFNLTNFIKD